MRGFCFLLCLVVFNAASAASFDCKNARTQTEKLICSDAVIGRMDEDLARTYDETLKSLDPGYKSKFIAEQKSWLSLSRSLCDDVSCLRRAYQTRIALLRECTSRCANIAEIYALDGQSYNLLTMRNANERVASFSKELIRRKMAPVASCESLVDVAVGTAHGNNSFGGICKLQHQTAFFMVCDDDMIGHFSVIKVAGQATRQGLADFTIRNCFGG